MFKEKQQQQQNTISDDVLSELQNLLPELQTSVDQSNDDDSWESVLGPLSSQLNEHSVELSTGSPLKNIENPMPTFEEPSLPDMVIKPRSTKEHNDSIPNCSKEQFTLPTSPIVYDNQSNTNDNMMIEKANESDNNAEKNNDKTIEKVNDLLNNSEKHNDSITEIDDKNNDSNCSNSTIEQNVSISNLSEEELPIRNDISNGKLRIPFENVEHMSSLGDHIFFTVNKTLYCVRNDSLEDIRAISKPGTFNMEFLFPSKRKLLGIQDGNLVEIRIDDGTFHILSEEYSNTRCIASNPNSHIISTEHDTCYRIADNGSFKQITWIDVNFWMSVKSLAVGSYL